ncbi:methyltransferase domain-containing protein [Aquibaculum sediminis]|uniref:methyltransferase domain-containing protein n=1 Tax=Aquibaculum sediminis TaxID=3231907 RepID=UPI003454B0BA
MSEMLVFDRAAVRRNRDRAAPGWQGHDFLVAEAAERLLERLEEVRRSFPLALDLGCHGGTLAPRLLGQTGVERVVQCDLSPAMARQASANGQPALAADEEFLPFAPESFDLAISLLSLHWVNDLPGALLQLRRVLKPDGLFLGVMLGGDSLHELRASLILAESELRGGAAPRVSAFAELRDLAGLLQRAGFALPVADRESLTVTYADPIRLLRELRGMAAANALIERPRRGLRRDVLARTFEIYAERFGTSDGRLPVTFEFLWAVGWAPHAEQPKPLRPGSAAARLAEALGSAEQGSGVPVVPPEKR